MKVFAISDLHLSFAAEKPMDVFGDGWSDHFGRVSENWRARVGEEDLVLLGGDLSWGMNIEQAAPDYAAIAALPGKKAVVKGNHDLYWGSLGRMQTAFPEFCFLQNNCLRFGNFLIAGSRGWTVPSENSEEHDVKIYRRELIRLELSLSHMQKLRTPDDKVIALLHFPPFDAKYNDSEVTAFLEKYAVDKAVYGHLHGKNARVTPVVEKHGISYHITSCDLIRNDPIQLY